MVGKEREGERERDGERERQGERDQTKRHDYTSVCETNSSHPLDVITV